MIKYINFVVLIIIISNRGELVAKVSKKEIKEKAIELLKTTPNGLHYSELIRKIKEALPLANENTIRGTIWDLDRKASNGVYKAGRGLFMHVNHKSPTEQTQSISATQKAVVQEKDEFAFYDSFRDYLRGELGDCDQAITLGGSVFGEKWSTPDVIGIRKSPHDAIIQLPAEITSAEIKISTSSQDLITGFGQACAYLLFSNKSYLVVPKQTKEELIDRLEALCELFGIGLILFDRENPSNPDFEIRTRPTKHNPDMFYVNYYLNLLSEEQKEKLRLY
jgi:hypothetical protein